MKKLFYFAALAAAVISCNKVEELTEPDGSDSVKFTATVAETKTTLVNEIQVHWAAEDAISIFGKATNPYWYQTAEGGATATFETAETIEDGLIESEPYALYPYNYEATVADNVITTEIIREQYANPGDFPSNQKPLLVAKSDASGNLSFQHASTVVKFTVAETDTDITAVYFWGNNDELIAGTTAVTYGETVTAAVDADGSWTAPSITLANEPTTSEDGTTTTEPLAPGTYYFVIAPQEFTGGITVQWVSETAGENNWRSTKNAVSAVAGHILNLDTLTYVETSSDETAPALTAFSDYKFSMISNVDKVFSVTATDETELASISIVVYDADNSYAEVYKETVTVSGTESTADFTLNIASAGNYSISAYATDAAGNQSSWWSTTITVTSSDNADTDAPTITLTSDATAIVGETYTLKVTFADATGIYPCWPSVYIGESTWTNYPTLVGEVPSGYWANDGNASWGTNISGTSFEFTLDINFTVAGEYTVYVYGDSTNGIKDNSASNNVLVEPGANYTVGTITVTDSDAAN